MPPRAFRYDYAATHTLADAKMFSMLIITSIHECFFHAYFAIMPPPLYCYAAQRNMARRNFARMRRYGRRRALPVRVRAHATHTRAVRRAGVLLFTLREDMPIPIMRYARAMRRCHARPRTPRAPDYTALYLRHAALRESCAARYNIITTLAPAMQHACLRLMFIDYVSHHFPLIFAMPARC